MDNKGQGALEYLLLIGGALLLAAIVLTVLAQLSGGSKNQTNNSINTFYNTVGV